MHDLFIKFSVYLYNIVIDKPLSPNVFVDVITLLLLDITFHKTYCVGYNLNL